MNTVSLSSLSTCTDVKLVVDRLLLRQVDYRSASPYILKLKLVSIQLFHSGRVRRATYLNFIVSVIVDSITLVSWPTSCLIWRKAKQQFRTARWPLEAVSKIYPSSVVIRNVSKGRSQALAAGLLPMTDREIAERTGTIQTMNIWNVNPISSGLHHRPARKKIPLMRPWAMKTISS